jgi:hypothetical protein
MNDLRDGVLRIPDYQRDSDQWSEETKSLLVESVINNLSIPAFFFEVIIEESGEKNEVIDGQQRLTTLFDFYQNRFKLVASDEAPYLSPNSVHYAEKTFKGLPVTYQQAFKRGSSPSRVGDFDTILDRLKHASENLQTQVFLVA